MSQAPLILFCKRCTKESFNMYLPSNACLFQLGVRTEGMQEALLKIKEVPENADRMTKMRQVMKAVSNGRSL